MKLIVTGGAGFIGSAVIRLAIKEGFSVLNIDSLTYAANLDNVADVSTSNSYAFENVDILDRDKLEQLFSNYHPDAVMHLAAESHVDHSINNPIEFIKTNITGTFNMLEAARRYWIKNGSSESFRFHHVSTDEVFGSLPFDPKIKFSETTAYDPHSPYAASKASSDHLVKAWHNTYNLPTLITNCSNNYGPFQFPEKLIPLVIINALTNKPLPIYGDGKNVRDWLYVEDHAKALLLTLKNGIIGQSYNIGGENEITNLELVKKVCELLDKLKPRSYGKYSELITFVQDRPGHDQRYAIDSTKIKLDLGWQPSISFDEGLKQTVNWYIDNTLWWSKLTSRDETELHFDDGK